MPIVDFTLEDVRTVLKDDIRTIVKEEVGMTLKGEIRTIVKEEIQAEVPGIVTDIVSTMLLDFWEHNLEPVLNEIHNNIVEIRTDIKELQAVTGLR